MTTVSPEFDIESQLDNETEAPTAAAVQRRSEVTVEQLLYLAIALITAVMRLANLGRIPLSPSEAREALAVWGYWQPDGPLFDLVSPAYFSLTSLLVQFTGHHDVVMRLLPALAGIFVVLLPYWLRPYIGRLGALITSLLLALSPILVFTSRQAGGDMLALAAALLLVVAWLHYRDQGETKWLYTLAVAIGLGLTTSAVFYSALITLLIAIGLERLVGPTLFDNPQRPSAAERRTAVLVGAGVLLTTGTLFLWNPAGLGATAALLANWFGGFTLNATLPMWLNPILVLGRYEAAVLLLGTLCAAWATWQSHPIATFFAYWFIGGLLLILLQAGNLQNVLVLTLPGYLLIGMWTNHLFAQSHRLREGWTRWPLGGLLLVMALVVAKNLGRFARIQQYTPSDFSNLSLAIVCVIMSFIVIALVITWDPRAALQGITVPVLIILVVFNWGQAWRLGYTAANDPRERWIGETTDDDLKMTVALMSELANQTTRDARAASIFSSVDEPAVRWYLRDLPQVVYGTGAPSTGSYDFLITQSGEPQVDGNYVGTDFGYRRPDTEHFLDPLQALRWWLFYQSAQPIREERAVLWIRTDLLIQE